MRKTILQERKFDVPPESSQQCKKPRVSSMSKSFQTLEVAAQPHETPTPGGRTIVVWLNIKEIRQFIFKYVVKDFIEKLWLEKFRYVKATSFRKCYAMAKQYVFVKFEKKNSLWHLIKINVSKTLIFFLIYFNWSLLISYF